LHITSTRERLLNSSTILLRKDFLASSRLIARRARTSRTSISRIFGTVENFRDLILRDLQQKSQLASVKQAGIDLLDLLPKEIESKPLHIHPIGAKLVLWCQPGTRRGGRIFGISINRVVDKVRFIAGMSLYAAEGTTYQGEEGRSVEFVNSSPSLVRLFLRFLSTLGVSRDRVSCRVELHEGLSVTKAESYWSAQSGIQLKNFTKPMIKKRPRTSRIPNKNGCLIIKFSNKLLRTLLTEWVSKLEQIVDMSLERC